MIEETGIGIRNPLWFVGVVEKRDDPRKEGRVQVRAFGVHGTVAQVPTESLPWAICISGNYDPNYPIPPLNAWVFGFFIDGRDAQQPMILGLIPTQMTSLIDPETNGWGVIPTSNVNLHSQGSRAIDYGQPQNSKMARGDNLDQSHIFSQYVTRVTADLSILEEDFVITEPAPGAMPVYPFNRVMETAGGHCFEMDDSPNAARVRLGHSEGQFLEMHQNGVTVLKAVNDLWVVSEANVVIIAKAGQVIKVEGDVTFSVDGNYNLDVTGDMRQVVHGNYELSVAGQLNLNGGEEIQARAGKVRIESNVEGINLKSSKKINIESGEVISIKSGQGILQQAVGDISIKSEGIFIEGAGAFNLKSDTMFLTAEGDGDFKAGHAKIGGGTKVSIKAGEVAIDDVILLASLASDAPAGADGALDAFPAEGTELPPPAEKASGNGNGSGGIASGGYRSPSFSGSGGYVSQDDSANDGNQTGAITLAGGYVPGDYADIEAALQAQGFSELEILATRAIIEGESGGAFSVTEKSWAGTDDLAYIRSYFSMTKSLSDAELITLKSNDTNFFNFVYGGREGNSASNNDGYNYRGRGLIQLTFKSNYARYAQLTGYDILNNPSLLNTDRKVGIAVMAAYMKDRKSPQLDGNGKPDPVADMRAAVAGTRTGPNFTKHIDEDRARYARLLKERGTTNQGTLI